MSKPRALIIGGSVGGLFAANMLRSIGWDADRVRAQRRGAGRPRRRHQHASAIARRHQAARHPVRQFDGHSRSTTVVFLDHDGRCLRRARHRAADELVGPRVPLAARSDPGRQLSARQVAGAGRAGRRQRHRDLRRRHARARRSSDRRRRRALDGARAVPAGPAAGLRRLCRLARHARRARRAAGDPRATVRELHLLPAAGRTVPRLSGARPQQRDASRASAPTTSSGTGRPRRKSSPISAPTRAASSHGTSIPPPLLRPDVIAWSKAQARALVAPQVAEIFERDPRPFFQAIFDFISPQTVFGRVALLGDAAFLARPHPGAGTTKCAMDAEHLADSIAALGIEAGLAKYQREQGAFGSGIVRQGQQRRLLHHRPAQAARAAPQQGRELGGRRPDARPRRPQRAGAAAIGREPRMAE